MKNMIQISITSFTTEIIGLIGGILIAIALYRIGEKYNESLVTAGGILYIFLAWIAAILLFIGLKNVEKKFVEVRHTFYSHRHHLFDFVDLPILIRAKIRKFLNNISLFSPR